MTKGAVSSRGFLFTTGKGVVASLLTGPLMAAAPALKAWASAQWCSDDPLVVLTTPAGKVFYTYLTVNAPLQYQADLTLMSIWVTATNYRMSTGAVGTKFRVNFHVPNDPVAGGFTIRAYLTSGPFDSGVIYDQTTNLKSGVDNFLQRTVDVL